MSLVPGAASLHTRHRRGPYSPRCCTTSMSGPWGTDPQSPGKPQEQIPVDDPQAEVGIKPQLSSRDRVAKEMCSYLQEDFLILTRSHKLLTSQDPEGKNEDHKSRGFILHRFFHHICLRTSTFYYHHQQQQSLCIYWLENMQRVPKTCSFFIFFNLDGTLRDSEEEFKR